MKKVIFFTLSIYLNAPAFSQITFMETFSSHVYSRPFELLPLQNNSSLIIGSQLDSMIYCVTLDSFGNVIQSKTFSTEFSETYAKGAVTKDNGFVFFSGKGLVVKCNPKGDIVWAKRLKSKIYPRLSPSIVFEDSHGGIILAYIVLKIDEYSSTTMEIVRIDKDGKLMWHTAFDSQQSSIDIYHPRCLVEANNEFFIGGDINYQWESYSDGALLRLNGKGEVLSFKRISSEYTSLTISKLWIKTNTLCAFGQFEGHYGWYHDCFWYFKDTTDKVYGDVVDQNVFSVQHYLELHKYLLPANLQGAYYEKNGSYVQVASNGYEHEISKFDPLGRICPDFTLPRFDSLSHSKLFAMFDKSYAIYADSVDLENVVVSEGVIKHEANICRGSADEKFSSDELSNQGLTPDNAKATLFPNPAKNIIILKYSPRSLQQINIVITTIDGRIAQSAKLLLVPGINTQHINIESLSSGLYLLKIKEHNKLTVLKFIKS